MFNEALSYSPTWEADLQEAVALTNNGEYSRAEQRFHNLGLIASEAGHTVALARVDRDLARNQWQAGDLFAGQHFASRSADTLKNAIEEPGASRELIDEYGISVMYVARAAGVIAVNEGNILQIRDKLAADKVAGNYERAFEILAGANNSWYEFGTAVRAGANARISQVSYDSKYFARAAEIVDQNPEVLGENERMTQLFKYRKALVLAPAILIMSGLSYDKPAMQKLRQIVN